MGRRSCLDEIPEPERGELLAWLWQAYPPGTRLDVRKVSRQFSRYRWRGFITGAVAFEIGLRDVPEASAVRQVATRHGLPVRTVRRWCRTRAAWTPWRAAIPPAISDTLTRFCWGRRITVPAKPKERRR